MAAHNIYAEMLDRIRRLGDELIVAGDLPAGIDLSRATVEPPADQAHGDMATNVAMVLAKDAGKKPRDLAETYRRKAPRRRLGRESRDCGAGLHQSHAEAGGMDRCVARGRSARRRFRQERVRRATNSVNVEYVSANPTGPMHVGHGRGAVFGDALANLLGFAGYKVTREYYVNDAGAQVDVLARSAFLRYREALGDDIGAIPEGLYPGDYLKPVGAALAAQFGDDADEAAGGANGCRSCAPKRSR